MTGMVYSQNAIMIYHYPELHRSEPVGSEASLTLTLTLTLSAHTSE